MDDLDIPGCYYCGLWADTIDHTIPRALLRYQLDPVALKEITGIQRTTVPACLECNMLLGSQVFPTLAERKDWLKARLRRRYHKLLRMPDWSEDELLELGPSLQRHVRAALRQRDLVRKRIAW